MANENVEAVPHKNVSAIVLPVLPMHNPCSAHTKKKDRAKTVPVGYCFEKWCPF